MLISPNTAFGCHAGTIDGSFASANNRLSDTIKSEAINNENSEFINEFTGTAVNDSEPGSIHSLFSGYIAFVM